MSADPALYALALENNRLLKALTGRLPDGTARTDEDARSRAILAHARLVQNEPSAAQAILESILWGAPMPDSERLKALADGDHARSSLRGEHVALGRRLTEARDAALEEAAAKGDLYAERYDADAAYPEGRAHAKAGRAIAGSIRALKPKPAPRAHLNGCGMDTNHRGPCVVSPPSDTEPEPVHDFGWALAQMRAGKKVRRKWSATPAVLDSQAIDMGWVQLGRGRLSWESMSATDWEVAE